MDHSWVHWSQHHGYSEFPLPQEADRYGVVDKDLLEEPSRLPAHTALYWRTALDLQ